MLFWILAGTLSVLVAWLLARPLLSPASGGDESGGDVAIYRDQLAEVDRDLARGVLAPEEAERTRTEIARRLLAADRAGPAALRDSPRSAVLAVTALASVVVVMGSLVLYASLGQPGASDLPRAARLAEAETLRAGRPSQEEAEAQAAPMFAAQPIEAPADYLDMVEQLREVVPTRPDDLEGWQLLALHEARLGNYAAAARAQERVIALRDEPSAGDYLDLADRMVAAAGGVVTPETEAVLANIEALDPRNLGLLYYLGLLEASTGRPDRAFPLWRQVMEQAPPDNLHRRLAEGQIADVAWLAGVDYQPPTVRGPSANDMAAAEAMDPEAQRQMVQGMVDGLRERLSADGGSPQEWAQLINALIVLGNTDAARQALADGTAAYEGDAEALALIQGAASDAGLAP